MVVRQISKARVCYQALSLVLGILFSVTSAAQSDCSAVDFSLDDNSRVVRGMAPADSVICYNLVALVEG